MRANPMKEKLARDGTVFGTMVFEFATPGLPKILVNAGAEFVLYDMEHSALGLDTIREQTGYCLGLDMVPLVRVPTHTYHAVASALDCGAMGIMVPMVGTPNQAEAIVCWAKYPPEGRRGTAFGLPHDDYAGGNVVAKMAAENDRSLVIVQIETEEGVANVDDIVAVPGVDVAWVGHFDLSTSMGIPGQFDHPRFLDAIERVVAACRAHGKTAAFLANTVEMGHAWMARGFRCVGYSRDTQLLAAKLGEGIAALKGA